MAGIPFVGITPTIVASTSSIATGSQRWNTTKNTFEVFDGSGWQTMASGEFKELTMRDMLEQLEDEIAVMIEGDYADNATIQDAFKSWEEANERFKVILAIAEKK